MQRSLHAARYPDDDGHRSGVTHFDRYETACGEGWIFGIDVDDLWCATDALGACNAMVVVPGGAHVVVERAVRHGTSCWRIEIEEHPHGKRLDRLATVGSDDVHVECETPS